MILFKSKNILRFQSGQIVVEYILLIVIVVSMALLIGQLLVSRNSEEPGLITGQWNKVLETIGADKPY